jgi:hypothetical protein
MRSGGRFGGWSSCPAIWFTWGQRGSDRDRGFGVTLRVLCPSLSLKLNACDTSMVAGDPTEVSHCVRLLDDYQAFSF